MSTHSDFLREMGVTEWVSKDSSVSQPPQPDSVQIQQSTASVMPMDNVVKASPKAYWMFFGGELKGDAEQLFQNIVRALGLSRDEWVWKSPNDAPSKKSLPEVHVPIVALAFGASAAQTITGERDPLPQLRETILALHSEEDIPVVATFDLNQLVSKPVDKALLWQDLLLAKSVLQNS